MSGISGPRRAHGPFIRPDVHAGARCYHRRVEIMGVRIPTIVHDNVARRCDGCGEVIDGTPWRLNVLDIVATEIAPSWTDAPAINPGPFQFHSDPVHVLRWMSRKRYLFCRKGEVREIMRPIPIPGDTPRWALCDGLHRDDHEIVPAESLVG